MIVPTHHAAKVESHPRIPGSMAAHTRAANIRTMDTLHHSAQETAQSSRDRCSWYYFITIGSLTSRGPEQTHSFRSAHCPRNGRASEISLRFPRPPAFRLRSDPKDADPRHARRCVRPVTPPDSPSCPAPRSLSWELCPQEISPHPRALTPPLQCSLHPHPHQQ